MDGSSEKSAQEMVLDREVPLPDMSVTNTNSDLSSANLSSQMKKEEKKQAEKRRRSSFASTRRSITGNVVSAFNLDSDSQSSSQKSTSASEDEPVQVVKKLKPNPMNEKIEQVIGKLEENIQRLNEESAAWKEELKKWKVREQQSELLSKNLTLPSADIPDDIKRLAEEYITYSPLDLDSIGERVQKLVLRWHFNQESCCQDMKLIQEAVNAVKQSNKFMMMQMSEAMLDSLSKEVEEVEAAKTDHRLAVNSRDRVQNFVSYTESQET